MAKYYQGQRQAIAKSYGNCNNKYRDTFVSDSRFFAFFREYQDYLAQRSLH